MAEADRWIWLGGSLLLAVVASQTTWWAWSRETTRARLDRFVHSPFFSPLLQVARLLYYIGIPFAALVWGHAVVGRLLGLQSLMGLDPAASWADWARDVGWVVALGAAAWVVLAVGWWTVRRAGGASDPAGVESPAWNLLREAAFHETHWAFYRNAPIVALRAASSAASGDYWGAWAGLGLVALEAVLNPWWRADLRDPKRAPAALVRAGLAVLSTVIYLQTGNLWLAVLAHWGVTWALAACARRRPGR